MNVEELKARLRALLHQRDSLPLSRWIGLRDDALESLHLWWLLFSGHGLREDIHSWQRGLAEDSGSRCFCFNRGGKENANHNL